MRPCRKSTEGGSKHPHLLLSPGRPLPKVLSRKVQVFFWGKLSLTSRQVHKTVPSTFVSDFHKGQTWGTG